MFWSLHGIAERVLWAIEEKLELPEKPSNDEPRGWFQQHLGPTDTSSQWHMKRFVVMDEEGGGVVRVAVQREPPVARRRVEEEIGGVAGVAGGRRFFLEPNYGGTKFGLRVCSGSA